MRTRIQVVLKRQTDWYVATNQKPLAMRTKVLVLGDDAAQQGPVVSPSRWRKLVFPYLKRIGVAMRPALDFSLPRVAPRAGHVFATVNSIAAFPAPVAFPKVLRDSPFEGTTRA